MNMLLIEVQYVLSRMFAFSKLVASKTSTHTETVNVTHRSVNIHRRYTLKGKIAV